MSKQLTAVAILALVAGTAMAAPRETLSGPATLNVNGASLPSETFTLNFTGADGGGAYMANAVRITGTLTSNTAGTWPADTSMDITPPGGAPFTIVLSGTAGGYVTAPVDVTEATPGPISPAGEWLFDVYDTFEDGDGTIAEAFLTDVAVTLDDATPPPPAPPSFEDLGTYADGTATSTEVVLGAAEVKWYKINILDCTAAIGRKLSVGTLASTMGGDSEVCVYLEDGSNGWLNDDFGGGLFSFVSFGSGSSIGVDMPAGVKYVAVGSYNTTYFVDFVTESTGPGGTFQLDIVQEFLGAPVAPESEDLGTLVDNTPVTRDITLGAAEVKWYKATIADCNAGNGRQLSISTLNTVPATDTEIGLYDVDGVLKASNDDNPYPRSLLTFGYEGASGDLTAGLYYIPVSTYNTNFLAAWNVQSTGAGGEVNLTVHQITSFPPVGVATLATSGAGQLLTIAVTGGTNPDSTGIAVTADLSETGGSATAALNDGGTNGDVTAGDGVYSLFIANPAGGTDGQAYNINWTVADAQSRSDTGMVTFSVDTNNTVTTAEIPSGTGPLDILTGMLDYAADVDFYRIAICDFGSFSATTVNAETTADTRLWLFNIDGTGVTFNDDSAGVLQSTLTATHVTANGEYYLAIGRYTLAAVDSSGQPLWSAADPFNSENAPSGAGAANPVASFTGASFGTAAYTINMTGACFSGGTGPCSEADIGVAGGLPGQDHILDNNDFIAFITYFFAQNPIADMGIAGGLPGSDGQFDNNDFIAFINHFFNDTVACNG